MRKITLAEEQVKYTALPAAFLTEDQGSADRFVVVHEAKVIGYFKIYRDFSNQLQPCESHAIGLRKFAIDKGQQGKGLGKETVIALARELPRYYPKDDWLYLTVNCKNVVAYQCYLKGGFEDTNTFYLAGPNGPQHIMRHPLVN
ncbi:GNAT family N-acetyltransferase [Enterovibrio makurazakiensis]|uniref:GNAT family N-acetyltransferase n=1 Tax=Enterovibrio makurazakiensis TaxID=2910232 RepID=UPI003D2567D5